MNNEQLKPKGAIAAIAEAMVWIVFFSLCFAYCVRSELVEVIK